MSDRQTAEGLRIGRVLGIDIVVDASWLLIAAFVTWAIQVEVGSAHPAAGAELWAVAAVAALAFFGSVLLHELAHSHVARRRGARVLRIRLFVFGGVSEIASDLNRPSDEFAVTVVGPLASAAAGAVFLAAGKLLPDGIIASAAVLLGVANVALAVFNLLPGFPLDGGRLLRSVVWRWSGDYGTATRVAVWSGQAIAVLLMAGGALLLAVWRQPAGLWYIAIGWFLFRAAADALTQSMLHGAVAQMPVGELVARGRPQVAPDDTILLAAQALVGEGDGLVVAGGRVVGTVDAARLELAPVESWSQITVDKVMLPIHPDDVISAAVLLAEIAPSLKKTRRLVVVEGERAVGVLTRRSVEERVRATSARRGRKRVAGDPAGSGSE